LQPTSPLRDIQDIQGSYDLLNQDTDVVFSVTETDKNPYFSLVEINDQGHAVRSKTLNSEIQRRQDAPIVYALNGAVYVWHRHTLHLGLWSGRSKCYVMPKIRSIDIDDKLDLKIAKFLASQ
jgi:CMP-N,N'-diacetyllegionaminic acid synthase